MFDESDPRYIGPATDALEALAKKDVVFEINTGGDLPRKQIKPVSVGGAARADRRARRACDTCERRALHRCRCI